MTPPQTLNPKPHAFQTGACETAIVGSTEDSVELAWLQGLGRICSIKRDILEKECSRMCSIERHTSDKVYIGSIVPYSLQTTS